MADEQDYLDQQIGNYRMVAELRKNFSIAVYLAQHVFLKRRTAVIKLLHRERLDAPQQRERFFQEAEFLDLLSHPYILPLLDAGLHDGRPYVMTEYAPHGSLAERIARQSPAPLPLEEAMTILWQIGQALHYSHQHDIVHGDLKPGNILFNAKGEAVLADFGLAMRLTTASLQHERAPEKLNGIITKEWDQYGLGCIAYELVTGRQPFTDFSIRGVMRKHLMEDPLPPTHLNPAVPVPIEQAILKALAKAPADRHPDVAAFLVALGVAGLAQAPLVSSQPGLSPAQPGEAAAPPQKTTEHWLDEGMAHYEAKHYPEALAAYEAASELDPADAYPHSGKGLVLCALAHYEEALARFEHAIGLDPGDAYAYVNKGLVLRSLERDEEALTSYERAIQLDPRDADAHVGKGLVLEHLQRDEEALLAYEEAITCNPSKAMTWQNKANVLQQLGRVEEAQYAYEKARQLKTIVAMSDGHSAT